MTTTTEKKKITVTMSERAPLKLDPDVWCLIASASCHDGQVQVQANTEWYIKVREHDDGRRVVYGGKIAGNGGQYAGFREARGGYLIPALPDSTPIERDENGLIVVNARPDEDATVRAIRRVAGIIGDDQLGDDCIADLPAEELT